MFTKCIHYNYIYNIYILNSYIILIYLYMFGNTFMLHKHESLIQMAINIYFRYGNNKRASRLIEGASQKL